MYRFLSLSIILLLVCCQPAPERNCEAFKIGTFTFTTTIDGLEKTTIFTRLEHIEIEAFEEKKDTSSVRWINDCEYVLKKLNPKNQLEEKSIHIKILTTSDSSYTFEYNAIGDKRKFKGEAIKTH
ncbi:DNA topoisomerase IV [Allomuricauda sp. SCSIO 65647]|uniref:DNA topoisomerase IV n=1 Tax=Allomuricauda sp. SCSIO 65647 TaxID=2908843 RepID=UPI001F333219|nr:DNA topoisomerase IV [Muricauda sp. SCSIO 65647]UJH67215.1 DNA topoisomerase IV [Muricauda sp. SCSIO 65647]